MRTFIRKWRRQRAADKVVRIGKQLRLEEAAYSDYYTMGYDTIARIDSLRRERDRLLDYIRDTAPQEA
jgi:hypothetical protein